MTEAAKPTDPPAPRLVIEVARASPLQVRALQGALEDRGWSVRRRPLTESRGAVQEVADIAVRLLDAAEEPAIGVIVAAVVGALRRRRAAKKADATTVVIYGPDGRELRRVGVHDDGVD